jgi:hypothetical protein
LVKAALATPAYLSVAWALMVSYQIFTQTAVRTVVDTVAVYFPLLGDWLILRIDMIVFIYAFAWVFVLSSIIPSLILGKERSVFVQFIVCLALTLTGFVLIDVLNKTAIIDLTTPEAIMSIPYMGLFTNLFFAAFYLAIPYILMLTIDYRSKKKRKDAQTQRMKNLTDEFFKKTEPEKPETAEKPK